MDRAIKKWTEEELALLEKLHSTHSLEDIALTMGRSLKSIQGKVNYLGLSKRPRPWTEEEELLLEELWGEKTVPQIARKLNRTEQAIRSKKGKMNMGRFADNTAEYLSVSQIAEIHGVSSDVVRRKWIQTYGLDAKKLKPSGHTNGKYAYYFVKLSTLLKWLEAHQGIWDSRQVEEHIYGLEPDWLKQKRQHDAQQPASIRKSWTKQEKRVLVQMYKSGYGIEELCKHFGRTKKGIYTKLRTLGIKRPNGRWSK